MQLDQAALNGDAAGGAHAADGDDDDDGGDGDRLPLHAEDTGSGGSGRGGAVIALPPPAVDSSPAVVEAYVEKVCWDWSSCRSSLASIMFRYPNEHYPECVLKGSTWTALITKCIEKCGVSLCVSVRAVPSR